jgi:hypothetical protein
MRWRSHKPASAAKVRIKVTWGVGRELILHSAEVPMDVLASLLRSVKTSQPATRRQRRPGGRPGGRKGEGCKRKRQARRKLIRERRLDEVVTSWFLWSGAVASHSTIFAFCYFHVVVSERHMQFTFCIFAYFISKFNF